MQAVNQATAALNPTAHRFMPGFGYLDLGVPPNGPYTGAAVAPAAGAADGSLHYLKAAQGAQVTMVWSVANQVWAPSIPGTGHRLAWTGAYLASHGWSYIGPASGPTDAAVHPKVAAAMRRVMSGKGRK